MMSTAVNVYSVKWRSGFRSLIPDCEKTPSRPPSFSPVNNGAIIQLPKHSPNSRVDPLPLPHSLSPFPLLHRVFLLEEEAVVAGHNLDLGDLADADVGHLPAGHARGDVEPHLHVLAGPGGVVLHRQTPACRRDVLLLCVAVV